MMESLVLCPEELCLGPVHLASLIGISPPSADLTIWTNESLEKGTRFLPWKGTVRSDKLPTFDKLPEFDIRHRFGLYDEISEVSAGRKVRQCNWIRFLRYSLVYSDCVNVLGTKSQAGGEPTFELIKDVDAKTELVCFFVPERPEEAFLLPAIQYLRHTLFKRLIDNVLEESPLDLSTSLVSKVMFPISPVDSAASAAAAEGRKSVSSDCTTTSEAEPTTPHQLPGMLPKSLLLPSPQHGLLPPPVATTPPTLGHAPPPSALMTPPPSSRSSPPHILSVESLTSKVFKPSPVHAAENPLLRNNNNNNNNIKVAPLSLITPPAAPTFVAAPADAPARAPVVRRREKNMLPCNYCGKAFDRPSLLKRHIRIHTGERPHVCDICSKGFSTSSSLNTHRRIHSGEKPHQCGVCGKRFTASSNLYYHKMTHVKEKPHKCTMCSKSFPTPGDLKSHTYVHTGTWPFKCHICHRGFSKQTNLKNHLLLHSGDKPYSCDICHKKFALSCNLRAHLKTHEAEYQSSSASLALYQRALAVFGSSQPPSPPHEAATDSNNDEDEDIEVGSHHSAVSSPPPTTTPTIQPPTSSAPGSEIEAVAAAAAAARMEFSKQLTVAV